MVGTGQSLHCFLLRSSIIIEIIIIIITILTPRIRSLYVSSAPGAALFITNNTLRHLDPASILQNPPNANIVVKIMKYILT